MIACVRRQGLPCGAVLLVALAWLPLLAADNSSYVCCDFSAAKICEQGGNGLFLSTNENASDYPKYIRAVKYLLLLCWCFAGVAIVADVFMAAIEHITSQKKTLVHNGHEFRVNVWNDTVANLTLMALGSSAPEILLSCIELFRGDGNLTMVAGKLGPSTIVGSAAFNLLGISAVCVSGLGAGETRQIKQLGVFATTATFSVLAYGWLLVILGTEISPGQKIGISPDVVEPWEGALTFAFFPVLVAIAYWADRGAFDSIFAADKGIVRRGSADNGKGDLVGGSGSKVAPAGGGGGNGGDSPPKEGGAAGGAVLSIVPTTNGAGSAVADDVAADSLARAVLADRRTSHRVNSRAAYRIGANRRAFGGQQVKLRAIDDAIAENAEDGGGGGAPPLISELQFQAPLYRTRENADHATLVVTRSAPLDAPCSVDFATKSGTAKEDEDFTPVKGTLEFKPQETYKEVKVPIKSDGKDEGEEEFTVQLTSTSAGVALGALTVARVVITDEIPVGVISFEKEVIKVKEVDGDITVTVVRTGGCNGAVTCQYKTEDGSARNGFDYKETTGTLAFADNERVKTLAVPLIKTNEWEPDEHFYINLHSGTGGVVFNSESDGSTESERLKVIIENSYAELRTVKDRLTWLVNLDRDSLVLGTSSWSEQFKSAVAPPEAGEDGTAPGCMAYFGFAVTLPWKIVFACIPPTIFWGGWLCFGVALCFIGVLTGLIGDLASMAGCCLGMPDEITAITIVALGTSLPDTFASLMAAQNEKYADNSIGNVTGSNSVNVFLGLGLPWFIGSLYWSSGVDDATLALWTTAYNCGDTTEIPEKNPDGAFVVPAGNLGTSVTVFTICAIFAIGTFVLRRKVVGAELGGNRAIALATSVFLVAMWFVYVLISSLTVIKAEDQLRDKGCIK